MIKYAGISFVAKPKFEQNSCKGCHWYPTSKVIYREKYLVFYPHNSIETYLLAGCLKMHEGNKGSLCQDLNIIFVEQ
jgi:hypothetical protein